MKMLNMGFKGYWLYPFKSDGGQDILATMAKENPAHRYLSMNKPEEVREEIL
jgi:hypothetical protein